MKVGKNMNYNLTRVRPERSKKRKLTETDLAQHTIRIAKNTKKAISLEASRLGISENMYINIILDRRDYPSIQKACNSHFKNETT